MIACVALGFAAVINLMLFAIAVAICLVTSILVSITSRSLVNSAKSKGSEVVKVDPQNE